MHFIINSAVKRAASGCVVQELVATIERTACSRQGFIVPFQALLPAPEPDRGFAFVYDPQTSTVKKTAVSSRGSEDKEAIIYEGLAAGDIIAVAGVSFLADGMKVKLMKGNGE